MRIKLLYIALFLLSLTFVSVLQSCELFMYKESIDCIRFTGLEPSTNPNLPDRFTNGIGFLVEGSYNGPTCLVPGGFGLISTCNAMTKCVDWQNELLTSSFILRLDKPVLIGGDTVTPHTDLFQHPVFRAHTTITEDDDSCKGIRMRIRLLPNLVSIMQFDTGVYTVTFTCSTSDNRTFSKQRQVVFR